MEGCGVQGVIVGRSIVLDFAAFEQFQYLTWHAVEDPCDSATSLWDLACS